MLRSTQPELRLLAVRLSFGVLEALIDWISPNDLKEASIGTTLHLSSHTLDATGRMIVFDGPRATPGLRGHPNLTLLTLDVPPETGKYRIQVEPVVENRFWASARGYVPLELLTERDSAGDLEIIDAACGTHHYVPRRQQEFRISGPMYGVGDSERCIEIPWALSRCREAAKVLDLGFANAEPRYVRARNSLNLPVLIGLDAAASLQPGIMPVQGDARRPPFRLGSFDLILAISVIEHIGRDNERYFPGAMAPREDGDLQAISSLGRLLAPQGRMLLTVPYGRFEAHGWFVQYDRARLATLVEASNCVMSLAEYYTYTEDGWCGPADPEGLADVPYQVSQGAAGSVACLELTAPAKLT